MAWPARIVTHGSPHHESTDGLVVNYCWLQATCSDVFIAADAEPARMAARRSE